MTRRRPPFTPEQIATIRAMREAGVAWRAIGAIYAHTGASVAPLSKELIR